MVCHPAMAKDDGWSSSVTSEKSVQLREATAADTESIRQVHVDAFGDEGAAVANLAIALLNDETAKPLFCLVAEEEDRVVGSIIFSRAGIEGHDDLAVYILAPLAVDPGFQHRGVGRALIEHGLDILRRQGASLVFVLGDPAYYARVGFTHQHHIDPPYELAVPEAWMGMGLRDCPLESISGSLACACSLDAREHW